MKSLKKNLASALNNIGTVHDEHGDMPLALTYYQKSLKLREEIGDQRGISDAYNDIGFVHKSQGNIPLALECYQKSLNIAEKIGDMEGAAHSYNNIGVVHYNQGDVPLALEYFHKSLQTREKIGDKQGVADSYHNIGSIYIDEAGRAQLEGNTKRRDSLLTLAAKCQEKSLAIREEMGDAQGMAYAYNSLGMIHQRQGNFSLALEFHSKSLKLREEIGDKRGVAYSYHNIGGAYLEQGNVSQAKNYALKSMALSKELGFPQQMKVAASLLAKIYKKEGNWSEALKYFELFIEMRDSLQSEENQTATIKQQMQYEYEKKAQADSIKAAEEKKVTDAQLAAQQASLRQERTQRYALYGGLALLFLFGGFMYNRFRVTNNQKKIIQQQKIEVEAQKQEADHQREIVQEKNKEILDSIHYARRLQEAILPPKVLVKESLPDSFILYKPKDIVAGDFYWLETIDGRICFAAADCTGHGVPGAMVSVVCSNALSKSVVEERLSDPGRILDRTRELVTERFGRSEDKVKDGMDISLCVLDANTGQLQWAGANNPLWMMRQGTSAIEEIKPDKQPVGAFVGDSLRPFTTHQVQLHTGDILYIFTDGYADQFGGEKGKKFKYSQLKELFVSIHRQSMHEQKDMLDKTFEAWRGTLEQVDDVCVMGVRI